MYLLIFLIIIKINVIYRDDRQSAGSAAQTAGHLRVVREDADAVFIHPGGTPVIAVLSHVHQLSLFGIPAPAWQKEVLLAFHCLQGGIAGHTVTGRTGVVDGLPSG